MQTKAPETKPFGKEAFVPSDKTVIVLAPGEGYCLKKLQEKEK